MFLGCNIFLEISVNELDEAVLNAQHLLADVNRNLQLFLNGSQTHCDEQRQAAFAANAAASRVIAAVLAAQTA